MKALMKYLAPISNFVAGIVFYSVEFGDFSFPLIVVWLIVAALYCTFYFGFINIKGFGTALSFLTSKNLKKMLQERYLTDKLYGQQQQQL